MPELPEVESICRMLDARITGKVVQDVEVLLQRIIRAGKLDEIKGAKFTAVERRGKYIIFKLDRDLQMYSHLRMTGTFLWKLHKEEAPPHTRASIKFEDGILYFRDIRTFGGIWIYHNGELPWKELGKDPFDKGFTTNYLKECFNNRKSPIKVTLLDQSLIAGIGNIYASEILFRSKIDPHRASNEIEIKELSRIRKATISILSDAIDSGGTTFRDFQLSDGKEGAFRDFLKVYNKSGEPCTMCKTTIVKFTQAQRSTYYCPNCQK
ncbi:DNA-formamidopyrimidine glycosylase [Calditrichota bacterium]